MEFEYLRLFADVDAETVTGVGATALAVTFATWFGSNILLPGIKERREERKDQREREFSARIARENAESQARIEESKARIEELRQKRIDEKEENDRRMAATETRGARETSHVMALNAVSDGQAQTLVRLERIEDGQKEQKVVLKSILHHLRIEYEWEDDDLRPTPTDSNSPPGGSA